MPADDGEVAIERLAALLPEGAVIGGWAAALAFALRDAGPTMASRTPEPVLAYLPRSDHRRPPGFAVRRSDLLAGEAVVDGGTVLTSPARTAYDLARFASGVRAATGFLDCALWRGAIRSTSRAELLDTLAAHPYGKGNPQFRAALALATGRSRSFPESSLRVRWVRELGVPNARLLTNATLMLGGGALYELDLVDLSSGLVVEYDGEHHADGGQRSRDARKDDALEDAGLVRTRCGAVEMHSDPRAFVRWASARRANAIARGSRERVQTLVASGDLAERPLIVY